MYSGDLFNIEVFEAGLKQGIFQYKLSEKSEIVSNHINLRCGFDGENMFEFNAMC